MSIHPEFATRIFAGEKLVEFRRRPAARNLTHLVVYATSPTSAVVGVAEIKRLERLSPMSLWHIFGSVGGIERSAFFAYFAGVEQGSAYVLGRTWFCGTPVRLGREGLPRTAPQAFQYVDLRVLDAVLGHAQLTANGPRMSAVG